MNRRAFIKTVTGIVTSAVCVGWGWVINPEPKMKMIPHPWLVDEFSWHCRMPPGEPPFIIYHPSQEKVVRQILSGKV